MVEERGVRQMVSVNLQIKVGVKHYLNLLSESYRILFIAIFICVPLEKGRKI